MNTADKQYEYLKRLLTVNKKMTVGQAAHRLRVLNTYIAKYKIMEVL